MFESREHIEWRKETDERFDRIHQENKNDPIYNSIMVFITLIAFGIGIWAALKF